MTRRDLEGLIAAGEAHAGLTFVPEVREAIDRFRARPALPRAASCLFAARSAVAPATPSRRARGSALRHRARRRGGRSAHQGGLWPRRRDAGREAAFEDVLFHAARGAFRRVRQPSPRPTCRPRRRRPPEGEQLASGTAISAEEAHRGRARRAAAPLAAPAAALPVRQPDAAPLRAVRQAVYAAWSERGGRASAERSGQAAALAAARSLPRR